MPRVFVIFALLLSVWASPAHADDRDKALKLFEDSDRAYKAGKFEEAATLLKEAYGIYPEPTLLYNLGRAQEGLGDTRGAVESYERYLKDAKQIKDRGAIERRIETLKAQIAKQEEDKRRHQEDEERRRREEEERRRNPPPPNDTRSPLEVYGPWATLGAGALVTVTGIYFGIHASNLHDDALATPIQRDAAELQKSAERSATTANVLLVAGAAIMAGGVVWKIVQLESDDGTQSAQVTVGPGQVAFQWSFP
jgi:tetratricopeptide (TPR) repeat protein